MGEHQWRFQVYLSILAILVVLGIVAYALSAAQSPQQQPPAATVFPSNAPPPTATDVVSAQQAFQYLVSFTANGFSPAKLTIQEGQTVRFTNNTNNFIRVLSQGADASATTTCPVAEIDSCAGFGYGQYWQHTFTKAGTFSYEDTQTHDSGTIIVQ